MSTSGMPCGEVGPVTIPAKAVQLVLVSNPHVNSAPDFDELARWVNEADPAVQVRVVPDTKADLGLEWNLPTLVVSFAPLERMRPVRGHVLQGRHFPKSTEYRRLEGLGLPVPRWAQLNPNAHVSLGGFGPYVVTKPDFGARGADVRIRRTSRVVWLPPRTQLARELGGRFNPTLVQEFIHTGPWPVSVRVTTLLGEVLWATRIEASHELPALLDPASFSSGGYTIVSSGHGCRFSLCFDEDVLALARQVHTAFPDVPLLGVDILRQMGSGALYVIEANSLGFTWHFSSERGVNMQREFGLDLDAQFGGRRRAAQRLARACRELAV